MPVFIGIFILSYCSYPFPTFTSPVVLVYGKGVRRSASNIQPYGNEQGTNAKTSIRDLGQFQVERVVAQNSTSTPLIQTRQQPSLSKVWVITREETKAFEAVITIERGGTEVRVSQARE